MEYDKPFKTIEEQLSLLIERNLIVTEESYLNDLHTLQIIPYHSLINGYKHLFQSKDDYFKPNVSLDTLKITYILNNELNNRILNNIIHVEKQFKNSIAYQISKKYGVETNKNPLPLNKDGKPDRTKIIVPKDKTDYLCESHYSGKYIREVLKKISLLVRHPYDNTLIKHYVENNNHVPPWILINDLSFGYTIKLYRILKGNDKKSVSNSMLNNINISEGERRELLINSICQLEEYRNIVAHGHKSNGVKYKHKLPISVLNKIYLPHVIVSEEEWSKGIGKNDITGIIMVTMILLNDLNLSTRLYFDIKELIELNNIDYAGMSIYEILNLPNDILTKIQKIIFYKYNYKVE